MERSQGRVLRFTVKAVLGVCRRLGLDALAPIHRSLGHYDKCRLALYTLRDQAELITVRRDGTLWTCHAWDTIITEHVFVNGHYCGGEIRSLLAWMGHHQQISQSRNVIVNVGANIGTTSIPLAQQTSCKVLAIEPILSNFQLLQQNVHQNRLEDRIVCVQAAIDLHHGFVQMAMPRSNCGGGIIKEVGTEPGFAESNEVREKADAPADTLRHILEVQGISPDQVAFVWSDTEGSEFRVIETGQELWRAGVPLYVEVFPEALRLQKGLDKFTHLAEQYFGRFIEGSDLVKDGVEVRSRPVCEIKDVVDRLSQAFTNGGLYIANVLLVPARDL